MKVGQYLWIAICYVVQTLRELWDQRDEQFSVLCVKHNHKPKEKIKFQGEVQTNYPKRIGVH